MDREYRGIAMRPRPQWGQGWRKGGYHHYEKRFSTEQKKPSGKSVFFCRPEKKQDISRLTFFHRFF
jgi:hypothetical protein